MVGYKIHVVVYRRYYIANAFFKAGFIESWGRGFEKIRNGFESVGLKWQLQKMQERNLIRRVGADNGGYWEIVTNETR